LFTAAVAVLALLLSSLLTLTSCTAPTVTGPGWHVVTSPNLGAGGSSLTRAAAITGSDIWAVGNYQPTSSGTGSQPLIEHWDGTGWAVVSSPDVGPGNNGLSGVAAVSASDVWVVGGYHPPSSSNVPPSQTLIERWNGTTWSTVSSPDLGTGNNYLSGVAAVSASDIWAVGIYGPTSSGPGQTLIEHWNGTTWEVVSSPDAGSDDNQLISVAAVSASDVWAVGFYRPTFSSSEQTLIEHWDGTTWSIVSSPDQTSNTNQLNDVAAVSASDVWAVGLYTATISSPNQTLIEHWNGTTWEVVSSPSQYSDDNQLSGVAAVTASDIWAVGSYGPPGQTLIEHWDGTTWSIVSSPSQASNTGQLNDVAAVSASDVWAVGSFASSSFVQTLVMQYP
jgi:hypothetical protein